MGPARHTEHDRRWNWHAPSRRTRGPSPSGRSRTPCGPGSSASLSDVFEDWQGSLVDSHGAEIRRCERCERLFPGAGDSPACRQCQPARTTVMATMGDVRARLFQLMQETPALDWLAVAPPKRPLDGACAVAENLAAARLDGHDHGEPGNGLRADSVALGDPGPRAVFELRAAPGAAPCSTVWHPLGDRRRGAARGPASWTRPVRGSSATTAPGGGRALLLQAMGSRGAWAAA